MASSTKIIVISAFGDRDEISSEETKELILKGKLKRAQTVQIGSRVGKLGDVRYFAADFAEFDRRQEEARAEKERLAEQRRLEAERKRLLKSPPPMTPGITAVPIPGKSKDDANSAPLPTVSTSVFPPAAPFPPASPFPPAASAAPVANPFESSVASFSQTSVAAGKKTSMAVVETTEEVESAESANPYDPEPLSGQKSTRKTLQYGRDALNVPVPPEPSVAVYVLISHLLCFPVGLIIGCLLAQSEGNKFQLTHPGSPITGGTLVGRTLLWWFVWGILIAVAWGMLIALAGLA